MDRIVELTLPADSASVRDARDAAAAAAEGLGAGRRLVEDVRLCVSEAATNAVVHAYGSRGGELRVVVEHGGGVLLVIVHDHGIGLAAGSRPRTPGHGLQIIETLSEYCRLSSTPNRGTELEMAFRIDGRNGAADR